MHSAHPFVSELRTSPWVVMDRRPLSGRTTRVAIVGCGAEVECMASRLTGAGHDVSIVPVSTASAPSEIAEACNFADVVISVLPTEALAEAVVLGPTGIVASLLPHAIHIGASSIGFACSDRFVEAHWDAGKRYVAAPVLLDRLHSPAAVSIIAGGCEKVLKQVRPLLRAIGHVITELEGWPTEANRAHLQSLGACTL
jgi:3-hydroxyisobutyrate dehydrogenase-like beta-hydroxyacid dehydrogenase